MSITERVAYLKGLMEGMQIDKKDNTGKLLAVMADILEDIALEIDDINENALDLAEEIDQLSDDLGDVEDFLDELCEDDDDECCCCDDDEDDECCCDDDDCCCDDDGEPLFFEIKCPTCGGEFTVDEDVIALDSIKCPKCGETLEFDFDEDEDDGCCCGHDHKDR
ncbi:MAG: hypothetical protein IK101_03925 [Oscillospiraceae bacterium]|nr:hypothetical protein [Oscillospiraceae bacterium]